MWDEENIEDLSFDELIEQIANSNYKLGISSGWDYAAGFVLEMAVDYFKKDNTELSTVLKGIHKLMVYHQKEARKTYDENFQGTASNSCIELERRVKLGLHKTK